MMNRKYLIPALASVLVLCMAFSSITPATAVTPVIGPQLDVVTIPEDDQKREMGIIVLGLYGWGFGMDGGMVGTDGGWDFGQEYAIPSDLMSQHKLLVSFNGETLLWRMSGPQTGEYAEPTVTCNILEKDKVNPVDDKFGDPTRQFPEENLVTTLIDVSENFICKPRWKTPADMPGWYESVGVLDVYYVGPALATMIADHILVVTVSLVLGRITVSGTDMQDICVLGFSMGPYREIALPDGGIYYSFVDPLGFSMASNSFVGSLNGFVSCEEAALAQRELLATPEWAHLTAV